MIFSIGRSFPQASQTCYNTLPFFGKDNPTLSVSSLSCGVVLEVREREKKCSWLLFRRTCPVRRGVPINSSGLTLRLECCVVRRIIWRFPAFSSTEILRWCRNRRLVWQLRRLGAVIFNKLSHICLYYRHCCLYIKWVGGRFMSVWLGEIKGSCLP